MLKRSSGGLKKGLRQAFVLTALFVLVSLAIGQTKTLDAQAQQTAPIVELPEEALKAPPLSSPVDTGLNFTATKLDSAMLQLQDESERSPHGASSVVWEYDLKVVDDRVQTRVLAAGDGLREAEKAIIEAGGRVTSVSELSSEIQAWIPLKALASFEEENSILRIRTPAYLLPLDVGSVDALTEGFAPLGVQSWHDAGERGAGAKVAVIDGGFDGYESLLGSDLPNSVSVKNFVDGEADSQVGSTTAHGTACTEIIYDIAPEAQYYLLKVATNLDLEQAVNYAIDQGVDVISTSIGWYNLTPGDGTGQFADLVNLARANGIIWLTAAGNDRQAHWGGYFNDPDGDDYHNFNGEQEINYFGPGDGDAYVIPSGSPIRFYLRWNDWQTVDQDFALHLVYWNEAVRAWQFLTTSDETQNGSAGQKPLEELEGTYTGSSAPIGFIIERKNGSRQINLEVFAPKVTRLDEYVPERSLPNLADAEAVVTVGAIEFNAPFDQETYSAEGPTNGPGGSTSGGVIKPDLAGYTGVSTETYDTQAFGGTSASAPHAAGAAALIKGAKPNYTPDEIEEMLQNRALDLGPAGVDTRFGHGRVFLWLPPGSIDDLDQHAYLPVVLRP